MDFHSTAHYVVLVVITINLITREVRDHNHTIQVLCHNLLYHLKLFLVKKLEKLATPVRRKLKTCRMSEVEAPQPPPKRVTRSRFSQEEPTVPE